MAAGDARTASVRAQRTAARKNAADLGSALANHYSPPPTTGGGQQHETIQHAVTRMRGQGYSDAQIHGELTNHWGYSKEDADRLVYGGTGVSTAPGRISTTPRRMNTAPAPVQAPRYRGHSGTKIFNPIHDFIDTQITRMGVGIAAGLHGQYHADTHEALGRIHVKGGKVTFSGTPAQQREAQGLLQLQGTGNILQKAGADLVGMGPGLVELGTHPGSSAKSMLNYYEQDPRANLHQDPFMFGMSYVLPAISGVGGAIGRGGALAETASALRASDLSLADIARLRERGALQHYLEHGELPKAGVVKSAGLLARSLIRNPVARDRTFTIGDQTFSAPASHNHIVNLFHRAVTDRLIAHALDNGHDILGFRGKVGRHIRANLRVQNAVTNADLSRLAKATKGLSAAQEHAIFVLSKGHTPESYARFAQNMLDAARERGDEKAATFFENQLHLTKIGAKYLEPGAEDAKVLKAASVIRDTIHHREEFYGKTDAQINHALGSQFYGIHTRANGLPDLHAELEGIEEQHGPPAESPRHYLDQHIANLQRYAASSKGEHAAELHAEIAHLKTLGNDVEFTQHRISQLDQRIEELGPTHYRGRLTEHPDRLGATHRELLVERARLQDHLETLIAHERHREIHAAFEQKGAELRGNVMQSDARSQLLEAAGQHGVDPRVAAQTLDARALRWARETGRTTRDFYEEYLHAVRNGGEVPDSALFQRDDRPIEPDKVRAALRGVDWSVFRQHDVKAADIANLIAEGQEGRFWYEDSAHQILQEAHGDKELADRIAQLVAIYSPQRAPLPNMQLAINAFHEWLHDGKVHSFGTRPQMEKANSILAGKPWEGRKTDRFYANMIEDIDPAKYHALYRGGEVTNDIWMARLFGLKTDTPTPREYEVMQQAVQRIADKLGWKPKQVQAALWIAKKARTEGTSVAEAGLNFKDALELERGTVPFEAAPGAEATPDLYEAYSKLSPAQQRAFTAEKAKLVDDFLNESGIFGRLGNEGPGVYEGNVNPGWSTFIPASRGKGTEFATRVAPAGKASLDFVASAIGHAFNQDAAAWFKPFFRKNITPGKWNGMKLELGRTISVDEAKALDAAFRSHGAEIAIVHAPDGAHLLNFYTEDNKAFHQLVTSVVNDVVAGDGTLKGFAFDGNYIPRSDYADHLERGASGANGPDLLGPAAVRLAERSRGVDERWLGGNAPEPDTGPLEQRVAGEVRGAYNPATREVSVGEHADAETFAHESLHAIRPSLDPVQLRSLETHYGIQNGEWTRAHEEQFVADMMRAARGEKVAPVVQSVFNSSLVAPPEAFYLPFERETKVSRRSPGPGGRRAGVHGYGPPQKEATHQFKGGILDTGGFRTKASQLATSAFTRAAHWKNMQDLHAMLWALSKETAEEAGRGRFGHEPIPIRDIRQIPDSLKEEAYGIYPGEILEGEAPDEIAKRLMEEWTKPPQHGEHVRWINKDFVRPLEPQTMGSALRFVNGINSAFRFGRYLTPQYLRWLPQNLVLNLTQQGPWVFRNAHAMFTELGKLDPVVYHQIAENVSFGSARALESETAAQKAKGFQFRVANAWAHVNDHIPRMLAFVHEAERAGFKTAKDWETLMTDPRLRSTRDSVIQRANKESIDYGAMTPRERVILKSFFAYWPWVRAASLWALRFPFEHPFQLAVMAGGSRDAQKHMSDFWAKFGGIAPPYMEGYFPTKSGPVDTSAINPWSQLGEDAEFLSGLTPSHPELAGSGAGTLSPLAKLGAELISGRDQNGDVPKGGVLKDAANSIGRTFAPFSLYRTATDAQTGSTPKGPAAAIMKWLGDPQMKGYDYGKGAKNALKDVNDETRARFMIEHDPNASSVPHAELQLVIRVAQIKDQTKAKSKDQIRALELADAAYQGTSLSSLNGLLTANGIRPVSQGDLSAERARQRSIKP